MNILNRLTCRRSRVRFRFRAALRLCGALLALTIPVVAGNMGTVSPSFKETASILKPYATAAGHRLQKPGKYKISAAGVLVSQNDAVQQTEPVRITWQYPMKIKLEQAGGSLVFDRLNPTPSTIANRTLANIVQVLVEDSVEGFFALLQGGNARRFLGSGFRLEGAKGSDPGVDILLLSYPDIFQNKKLIQKAYWFNSHTKLLGVVGYTSSSGLQVHVVIEDWRDVGGEKIPFRIERWEDSKRILQLNLKSANVMDSADDGSLGGN